MTVSAVSETMKVRPTDPPPSAQSSIALSCAQNEFCAFQVAVSAPSSGAVTVTNLAFPDSNGTCGVLPTAQALVYREGFLDVTTTSNQQGATGLWPDPLIPTVDAFYGETRNALPVTIPAGQTQAFWVELLIPPTQGQGVYNGTLTVGATGETGAVVSVAIHVRGFALPSTSSLSSAYGFDWDGPCVGHFGGYGPPNCDDAQLEALNALYFQDALNHRISISSLVYAPPITNGTGTWTTFDSLYGPFLDGTALTGTNKLAGAKLTAITYTGDQVAGSYAAWAAHAKANGWFDRVFDYTCDEPPNGCGWNAIPTRAAIVHAGDPNFRTLTTTTIQAATTNNALSSLDILVPIINEMYGTATDPYPGDQRSQYDSFLAQPNKLLWMYQSCEPSSSCSDGTSDGYAGWPTMFIDETALSNRMMQWMDFTYQVSGELYYDTTYAMSIPTNDAWSSQYEFGNNGDGSIFYPGKPSVIGGTHDIPIESIRMKMLREGMQDYEYLHLLTTLGDTTFVQTELAKVVTNAGSYTSDPTVIDQVRGEMADEIEKLMQSGTCDAGFSLGSEPLPMGEAGPAGGEPSGGGGGCNCDQGVGASSAPFGLAILLLAVRRRRATQLV